MNSFVFQNTTKLVFGQDQLSSLGQELKKYGSNVLLTYGGGSIKKMGLYDKVVAEVKNAGLELFEFGGIEPNPRIESVNAAAALCKEKKIDVILAVGGGSTIDASKFIAAGTYYDGDVWDLVVGEAEFTQALPLLTILTLSATGTEMNSGGVISRVSTHEKYGNGHPIMLPKVSFLDPSNTFTVNAFQTAAGAADILSHVIEQYFNLDTELDIVDEMMESIMRSVIKNAPIALKEPTNYEARANLMYASTWALNGFVRGGKRQAWTVHPMEHELSAYYDITHGLGLAILTPPWMNYVLSEQNVLRFKRFATQVFNIDSNQDDMKIAQAGIKALSDFLQNVLQLPGNLSLIKIDDTYFKEMARKACDDSEIQGFMTLTQKDVEAIFRNCL